MYEQYEEGEESSGNEQENFRGNFVGGQEQYSGRAAAAAAAATADSSDYVEEASPSEDSGYREDDGYINGNGQQVESVRRGRYVPEQSKGVRSNHAESYDQWVEEEEEEAEEEEEGNGGDDPHDADFEPGSPQASVSHQDDDDDYNDVGMEEDDEEADEDPDDIIGSDSDEYERATNQKKRRPFRVAPPKADAKRRKVVRKRDDFISDESSAEECEQKPVSSFRAQRMPAVQETVSRSRVPDAFSRDTTRSRRSVPRKSYAEEEESEDDEEELKARKAQKAAEEAEEEDLDKIERVLWHQPLGTSDAARREGKRPEPFVLDTDPNADLDWSDQEFYIKWKGQSYLHCQWQSLSELSQLSGYKKVLNYMKKIDEERIKRRGLTSEEAEAHDLAKEMELDFLRQYVQVERIFADRTSVTELGEECQEYYVKWKGLPYAESTWERDTDLHFAQEYIDEYKEREVAAAVPGKSVDLQRNKMRMTLRRVDVQPQWLKGGELRDYQLEGLNWLVYSWIKNVNVILADEMGLGKTVQSVSMLGFLQNDLHVAGPFLVVVPLSTITNWAKEFRKWLPNMNVVVYIGNRASREMCQKYEFYANGRTGRTFKFNTLLTTYDVLLKDKDTLSAIKWDYLMLDEAHRLKNAESQTYLAMMEFKAKNKVLITGTPLQNSVEELWALLHFLDPETYRYKDSFVEKYKNITSFDAPAQSNRGTNELESLHAELRPHLLRRVIKDVEKSLPPKIERILRVEMSPLQRRYYKWILERNFDSLNKGVRGKQVSLLNVVVELKKCCNHPFLFESAEEDLDIKASMRTDKLQTITYCSGKLVLLDKLLVKLRDTGHRVLIFSQMVKMLDILGDYLNLRGFKFQRLDGSTRHDVRMQVMEHFNAPGSEDFCFLLSTRAGGLGINLATADTVIIFDSDWNPQNDLQAMSRAHRIGQREVVNVYRFVTSKSVEEDILERAKKKMVLDHLVIQKLNNKGQLMKEEKDAGKKTATKMFDKNELAAILRFGAEELFKENDEETKDKLENMDIDEILERAEKVTGSAVQEGNELLGAFKVANFAQDDDDVTFWSRLIQPKPQEVEDRPEQGRRTARGAGGFERSTRRRRGDEDKVKLRRTSRSTRASEPVAPRVEGAAAQVFTWQAGNISKRDANAFIKGVKKFGDKSRLEAIVSNTGSIEKASEDAQLELFDALIEGCQEAVDESPSAKASILDFFGVSVKAHEVLSRVKELTTLGKRIRRFQDPVAQFRVRAHPKSPAWSTRTGGWSHVDDARLLLGVYYHGVGNWETIRADTNLKLSKKIPASPDVVPKPSHLEARVNMLLRKELEHEKEPARSKRGQVDEGPSRLRQSNAKERASSRPTGTRKSARNINREMAAAAAAAAAKEESEDKEEGEISVSEGEGSHQHGKKKIQIQDQERELRWHNWCEGVMEKDIRTLKRLQGLQDQDLPNDEVVAKVRKYLQKLGKRIDDILQEHRGGKSNIDKMAIRLWNYVAEFSDLDGPQLAETYKKLKADAVAETKGGSTKNHTRNGNDEDSCNNDRVSRGKKAVTYQRRPRNTDEAESWKRRRREADGGTATKRRAK